MNNVIEEKSFNFSIRIVKLYQYLTTEKKEQILAKQLLKSGTSIGANIAEAECGQTKADFYAKMCIAVKEANETQYWLRLLFATEYISEKEFNSINQDVEELISILVAITKTTNSI